MFEAEVVLVSDIYGESLICYDSYASRSRGGVHGTRIRLHHIARRYARPVLFFMCERRGYLPRRYTRQPGFVQRPARDVSVDQGTMIDKLAVFQHALALSVAISREQRA